MLIAGLDVGTTGCKLTTYTDRGELVHNEYRTYEVDRSGGEHELDGNAILAAVLEVIRETASKYELSAIGVTTFGEAFVLLDEHDEVLTPIMLYTDPRGETECRALCEKMGEATITRIAGVKPHAMYSLPKLLWLKHNRPEVFSRAKRVLLIEDFIVYMLSGVATIDHSLAARTMAFDIRSKCWSDEILCAAGIEKTLFSRPVRAGFVAGELKSELCAQLGIHTPVKIVNGAHDQVAAAVGAGIFRVGQAVDGTGTVECVTPLFDHIPENSTLFEEGYSVVPYVFDGTYVCYALSFTGGAVIKWFRDQLSAEKSYAVLDGSVKEEPTGILVLPHFAGAANPYMDHGSKAAILGLTLEHTSADLYKALMEGVTFEMLTNIKHLEGFGIKPEKLFATGGGAASEVWLQIKADVLNRPVTALLAKEAGACGTCMLVGVAVGLYPDLPTAAKYFVKEKKTFYPDPARAARYAELYGSYQKIYNAVRPII